jgi:fatty acid desaturase
MYSLGVLSLHDGAAHNAIFSGTGAFARAGQFLSRNICRVAGAEPESYATCHMAHHAKFGTEEDSEFLNFVLPRRYWMTFWPLAALINFTDFVSHRPLTYTRSRVLSASASALYNGVYASLLYRSFGLAFTLLTMVVFLPHVGFYMDRLRQFTEHNLMPLENRNGARSFGIGFWGLLLGGGPWGQPCHLVHHLVASIPWYQQIVLHRYMKKLLTERQRKQFLLTPVIGFPKLLWSIVHDAGAFARVQASSRGVSSPVEMRGG